MKYLYQNNVYDLDSLPKGYQSSTNEAEANEKFVKITDVQYQFKIDNPTASNAEIIACRMLVDNKRLALCLISPFLCGKSVDEIKAIDVTMLSGLYNFKRYSRGYKIYSRFFNAENFEDGKTFPVVERIYSLVWDNDILVGEKCVMNWYYDDGLLAFSKETIENYSAKDAASKLREIRQIRIDYLQYPEPQFVNATTQGYITALFARYKAQVNEYILSNNKAFEDAINNESNATYLAILNATLADGKTVRESILYQISGGY